MSDRLLAAFNNLAALDKNTGLVWERTPDNGSGPWGSATYQCVNKNLGGARGWRLPSVAELASLMDPTLPPPYVPANIFSGVEQEISIYWSGTTYSPDPAKAWEMSFSGGVVTWDDKVTYSAPHAWCVRGGAYVDAY